jgi:hypothetical protein
MLTEVGLRGRGIHGDASLWFGHPELHAIIVRNDHELLVAWAPKQCMVGAQEVHHLEGEDLLLEIGRFP